MDPAPVDRVIPGIPSGLAEIVQRMMSKPPAERYATPAQVARALKPYTGEYARARQEDDSSPGDGPTEGGPRTSDAALQLSPKLARAILDPVDSDSPRGTAAVDPGAGTAESTAPLLTPDDGPEPHDSEVLLVLDSDQSWHEEPGQPAPQSSGDRAKPKPVAWLASSWFWGLVALIVIVTFVIAILTTGVSRGDFTRGHVLDRPRNRSQNDGAGSLKSSMAAVAHPPRDQFRVDAPNRERRGAKSVI